MEKDRQKELQETLIGLGPDKKPFPPKHYEELSLQDTILLHHMAAVFMQNHAKDDRQKIFFGQRMAFFENQVITKLWAMREFYAIIHKGNGNLYVEKNTKTDDRQIFIFSTREGAKNAAEKLSRKNKDLDIKEFAHNQFPPFYLNLFPRGITAVILDWGQTPVGLPLWAICGCLKEEFVLEQSRPAVHLWTSREMYLLYSTVTQMPYAECDSETYDDMVYLYTSKDGADAAVKAFEEKNIPVTAKRFINRQFHQTFFNLYLMGVNAVHTEKDGIIQLNMLVPKPDYTKLPEEKRPILNPELLLTAVYVCQEERRPQGEKDTDELKQMKEELMAHLREGWLAMPVFTKDNPENPGQLQFPIVTLTNGERYCPVFTDVESGKEFEKKQKITDENGNHPEIRYIKMFFDKILQILPPQIQGVTINPNTINLIMKKTQKEEQPQENN